MPQLDVTWFPTQLVWLAITFIALYAVISLIAVPRIGGVLEERQRRIDDDLGRATALKAEAEAAIAAYEKSMTEARNGSRELLRKAADALIKESEERQKALGDKLAEQIKAGEARITASKKAALAEVQTIATDLARAAALKLADVTIDETGAAAAVRSAMSEGGL
ncbi:MAG TPA: F0F1 ATP synthase subunit B' [Magnetospirillaceae bacterium]|jgi:F-type H+-transporting ATPase subunit b